jgi:hypothetical protein
MERGNGRVEPGQRMRGMSARAWNRAQDAADVVLGTNPDVTMPGGYPAVRSLSMPMLIRSAPGAPSTFPPGTVVLFENRSQATALRTEGSIGAELTPPYTGYFEMPSAVARISTPYSGAAYTPVIVPSWGVTTEGGIADQSVVPVIVAGVAPVRVRSMTYGNEATHMYAIPTIKRASGESNASLAGVLESTMCSCENAARIIYIDGQTAVNSGGSDSAKCFWALVVI